MEPRTGRLPAELTSFVGRQEELARVQGLFGTARLITLAGSGGVGKTRLAVRAAAGGRPAFPDGVYFVDLSRLGNVELLAHTLAAALQVPDQPDEDQLDALTAFLEHRRTLLILDSCEHLVDGCAILAEVLLQAAPHLHILVTSREALNMLGEHVVPVAPLAVTGDDAAVALFADRAAAAVPGFGVDDANREVVTELCRRLEGIPLAIELAAVRLRTLTAEQLLHGLDDRFRLLGPARTGADRHQTLTAAIGWSHELCTPVERRLWARLSVFAGDFDLKAAEYVAGPVPGGGPHVLETLFRLVEKSIVVREAGGERYRMLDTIAGFGRERLAESGEEGEARCRHRDWFLKLTDRFAAQMVSDSAFRWAERLRAEHADLRRAMDFCLITPGEEEPGLRMAGAVWLYWMTNGMSGEGRHWIGRGLAAAPAPSRVRAEALWAMAELIMVRGADLDAARPYVQELRELADTLGTDDVRAWADSVAGQLALFDGDAATAIARMESAIATLRRYPAGGILLQAYPLLASAHCMVADADSAIAVCDEGRAIGLRFGERWFGSYCVFMRGLARWLQGDTTAATAASREALRLQLGAQDQVGAAFLVDSLAWYAMADGNAPRAARLLGATKPLWDEVGRPHLGVQGFLVLREQCERRARRKLGDEAFDAAVAEGATHPISEVIDDEIAGRPEPAARRDRAGRWAPLSRREAEVARLVAEGLSNREIAERLVIARRTAESHMEHIMGKLDLRSRTLIALWVTEREAADPPGPG